MSKSTVTRLFIGGTLAAIAGAILAVLAFGIAYAGDMFVMNGDQLVGVSGGALAWSLIGVGILGAVTAMGGAIAGLVSWIGALLEHLAARQQGLVRQLAPAGDLQLRVPRDDRLCPGRAGWHGRGGGPQGPGCTRTHTGVTQVPA